MKIYRERGTRLAHRLAYFCAHGFFPPDGLIIRHACDNPRCCNPAHLFEGTRSDNVRDQGRTQRGEKHWKAKVTEADVRTIRSSRDTQAALAQRFGVSILSIHNIRHRKTWRHVA